MQTSLQDFKINRSCTTAATKRPSPTTCTIAGIQYQSFLTQDLPKKDPVTADSVTQDSAKKDPWTADSVTQVSVKKDPMTADSATQGSAPELVICLQRKPTRTILWIRSIGSSRHSLRKPKRTSLWTRSSGASRKRRLR